MFRELEASIEPEVETRLARAAEEGCSPRQRGATWTYLTTDEPFGTMTARIMQHVAAMLRHYLGLP
jgi:hypothetical protein